MTGCLIRLIVNIGGQGANLASAYVLDPSIAHKCVVYYTDIFSAAALEEVRGGEVLPIM